MSPRKGATLLTYVWHADNDASGALRLVYEVWRAQFHLYERVDQIKTSCIEGLNLTIAKLKRANESKANRSTANTVSGQSALRNRASAVR